MHVNDVVNKKKWKGNKIMERICILAFLGINSWKDIHTREVSLLSIGVFGIVGMVRACFLGTVSVNLVWNVCMGAADRAQYHLERRCRDGRWSFISVAWDSTAF